MPDDEDVLNLTPPFDMDVEAAVLSACIIDPEGLPSVADIVVPEHFYSEAHRRIYEAAIELFRAGTPVDTVQVATWLKDKNRLAQVGGLQYITEVLNAAPAVKNVRAYGERVRQLWRLREVQVATRRILAESYGATGNVQEFLDTAARTMMDIAYSGTPAGLVQITPILRDVYDRAERAQQAGGLIGVRTGFERFDRLTGGLHDQELTIIAARPGMGKTSLVIQWAVSMALAGEPVAFFSMEMPKEQVASRAACGEGSIDANRIRIGNMRDVDWSALSNVIMQFPETVPLFIDDSAGQTILSIRSRARRLDAELQKSGRPRLRLIVVDYLQLMHGTRDSRRQGREREISEIAQDLKETAKEFKVPVVALSQMNRLVEQRASDKKPKLSDLRESGNIEQAADTVMFINPREELGKGVAELLIEKQRNGPTGDIRVVFDKQFTRFRPDDTQDNPQIGPSGPQEDYNASV